MNAKSLVTAALLIAGSSLAAQAADTINVATNIANVPFEFQDGSGTLMGFEVDIMRLVGEKLGKPVEFQEMPFQSLFAAVQSTRSDVAIGSITITPTRMEQVAFTQPMFDADQCLTVGAKSGIEGVEGMEGKTLAVITGTTGEIWASESEGKLKFASISRYDGNQDPMMDIATGRIDGFVHDCPIDAYYIKDKPQFKIVATIPTNEQFGLMLPKNSPILEGVNKAITELKESGEMAKLHEKWFGMAPAEDSSTVKVLPMPGL
ncbi:transporter substrate-binding domain-containing protein [Paracoccus aminophilus]|uniref:ABC-type amino acid transport/signal transduction systems, periplasmic component n=1 Tax=Paracoccus aminophilus JCM 7686 TaxID=1367847 RepID=S5XZX0_PARAH|nr:transporter substrate-binding domain-containing protein [Paracoccus aminophilus]AGT10842.1 ABC-type amino acid transport/signal transduction systems, periplasmic component [Paracoccus aminophilus JCM 7686]